MNENQTIQFKKGEEYHIIFGLDKVKIHIVEVIDEGLSWKPMIVYRHWSKSKKKWVYQIQSAYLLTGGIENAKESDK